VWNVPRLAAAKTGGDFSTILALTTGWTVTHLRNGITLCIHPGRRILAMVETVHLAHMPPDLAVYVALYRNVENAAFLKEQLLAGNAEFEYAFIDASMVGPSW